MKTMIRISALALLVALCSCGNSNYASLYKPSIVDDHSANFIDTAANLYKPTLKNHDLVYLVDTISIKDPVVISYNGNNYVTAGKVVENNEINGNFFGRANVFLLNPVIDQKQGKREGHDYGFNPNMAYGEPKLVFVKSISDKISIYKFEWTSVRFSLWMVSCSYLPMNKEDEKYPAFFRPVVFAIPSSTGE